MDKTTLETIIAVFVGIILGIIVASGFWFLKSAKMAIPKKPAEKTVVSTPTNTPSRQSLFLSLTKPQDQSILNDKSLIIEGKTTPETRLITTKSQNETVVKSDGNGNFNLKLNLDDGVNTILITAVNDQNETKSLTLTVVYEEK